MLIEGPDKSWRIDYRSNIKIGLAGLNFNAIKAGVKGRLRLEIGD